MPSAPWRYRSGMSIPPVIILNSGRCGSTMLSDVLNRHPRILSLSEFFSLRPCPQVVPLSDHDR